EAAVAVVELMQATFDTIQPSAIVDAYIEEGGGRGKTIADALWEHQGKDTVKLIVRGCRYLAMLWDSAWKQGRGDDTISDPDAVAQDKLIELYEDKDFMESHTLKDIGAVLQD